MLRRSGFELNLLDFRMTETQLLPRSWHVRTGGLRLFGDGTLFCGDDFLDRAGLELQIGEEKVPGTVESPWLTAKILSIDNSKLF